MYDSFMISIYQYESYKSFFNDWVAQQPKKGHGEYRRLAMALNVSTTMISQIFNSEKDLSLELACEMSDYLLLRDEESEYFLLLVEHSKAGSAKLKSRLMKQIKDRQDKAKKLENRVKAATTLGDQEKNLYYSNWTFQAIRLLAELSDINSVDHVVDRLALPKNQVIKTLDFLIKNGLVIQKGGKLSRGPTHVYLPASDSLVPKHHWNWRQLGIQKMTFNSDDHFFYTGQYSLSEKLADQIRKQLPDFIKDIVERVKPSESETIRCLNIDFFDV